MSEETNLKIIFPKIILASTSAIRAEILTNAGIKFEARPSYFDEDVVKKKHLHDNRPVTELVKKLAFGKADTVKMEGDTLIVGADQVLEFEGKIFDKPKSLQEANERLKLLRGQTHCLVGGLCLLQNGCDPWYHICTTKLTMRKFSSAFLKHYLQKEGGTVLASVGAYKFEGRGATLFESVEGDLFSILGLPLLPLIAELRRRGALMT